LPARADVAKRVKQRSRIMPPLHGLILLRRVPVSWFCDCLEIDAGHALSGNAVDEEGGPVRWLVIEVEMDHDGIVPGPSWSLRGRFLGCVAQLGLAFRGVPRL
jgi:hypothetical protein